MTTTRPRHECCPNATQWLKAFKARAFPNAYRWHMCGLTILFCPWCAAALEVERKRKNLHVAGSEP